MMLPRNRGLGHNSRKRLTDTHALVEMVIPGALAIRAVSRVGLPILVVWPPRSGWLSTPFVAAATIAGVCLLEHGVTFDISLPSRKGDAQWSSPERPTGLAALEDCPVRRPRGPRSSCRRGGGLERAMAGARLAPTGRGAATRVFASREKS